MFDKLEAVEARYEELTKLISDPEVIANQTEWQKLIKMELWCLRCRQMCFGIAI